ncbi:tetratricopeptide repeat protein [Agitococcus lubricus]|uniref:Flp pilus assembly protein TadD n=1 Tax=Agitococcus lubricus TaxID=1077255 RepID=A0A2T5IWH4_9GAMM|nr:tetratricopeptide repeat protein [Agitococcus lubricus]PTQ88178.1 Flp pilus assembly protein TadD [Agitococcus lubricus]
MLNTKQLGLTILMGSLLAACASSPKKAVVEEPTTATTTAVSESTEPDLEKLAKERAAQGIVKKDDVKEVTKAAVDTSQEPELPPVSDEQKKLAAPVLADYQQALTLLKAQQWDDAYNKFEEVQAKAPQFVGPVLNQVLIRIQQQNFKEADLLLKKAQGINSKNPYIYNLQGFVLRQQGQFVESRKAYEQALTISPKYAKAHFNLGVLADLYLQDLPFALQHYEAYQALQTKPDATVAKWIVDLQKRTGVYKPPVKAKVEEVIVEETPTPEATPASESAPSPNNDVAPAKETVTPDNTSTKAVDSQTDKSPTANPETTNTDNTTASPNQADNSSTPVVMPVNTTATNTKSNKKGKKQAKNTQNVKPNTATVSQEAVQSTPVEQTTTVNAENSAAAGAQP